MNIVNSVLFLKHLTWGLHYNIQGAPNYVKKTLSDNRTINA